jgi:heme iron utilization protein
MTNNHRAPSFELVQEILASQYYAVLTTDNQGQPYSSLVAFAEADNLKSIVFFTKRETQKYKNILENNRVSLMIDSRTNQPDDVNRAVAIAVIGLARESDRPSSGLISMFLKKHPHLSHFLEQDDAALMVISVSECFAADFQNSHRIII